MIYIKRLLAVLAVFFSLVVFIVGFPIFAAVYVFNGRDLTDKIMRLMPGKS